jgi:hypothetical protein
VTTPARRLAAGPAQSRFHIQSAPGASRPRCRRGRARLLSGPRNSCQGQATAPCDGGEREATHFIDAARHIARELDHPFTWMIVDRSLELAALLTGDTDAVARGRPCPVGVATDLGLLAMQKVVGSSPISRFRKALQIGVFLVPARPPRDAGYRHRSVNQLRKLPGGDVRNRAEVTDLQALCLTLEPHGVCVTGSRSRVRVV